MENVFPVIYLVLHVTVSDHLTVVPVQATGKWYCALYEKIILYFA